MQRFLMFLTPVPTVSWQRCACPQRWTKLLKFRCHKYLAQRLLMVVGTFSVHDLCCPQQGYRHPQCYCFSLAGYSHCICISLPPSVILSVNGNQAWAFEYVCVHGRGGKTEGGNVNTAIYSWTCSSLQSMPIQLLLTLCRVMRSKHSVDNLEN